MAGEFLYETIGQQSSITAEVPPILSDDEFSSEYDRHVELVSIAINYQDGNFDKAEQDRKDFIRMYPDQFQKFFGPRIVDLEIDI